MARKKSAVFVTNREIKGVEGLVELQRRIAAIPQAVTDAAKLALEKGADEMVAKVKSIAPVAPEFESQPGQLRDSVHREPGRHELAVVVVEDARDAEGHLYPGHVEYGHKAADGSHVAAKPHFWPAYQLTKKKRNARINRAIKAGIKAGFAKS
jgi:hypothetical protein